MAVVCLFIPRAQGFGALLLKHIDDILSASGEFKIINSNGHSFLEKILSDGRGVRLNMDSTFKGFIDQIR